MQKEFLKYLIPKSKKFAKKNKLFDIILYGSVVKGKLNANDLDILIIFENEPLKKRTEIAQEFKKILKKTLNLDLKTINLKELFEKEFLARQGILIEGYSLVYDEEFAKRIGFKGKSLFTYNLKNLTHNEKTRFIYALIGRRNREGIIKIIKAEQMGKGVIKVPIETSNLFEEFLQEWKIKNQRKDILETE